MAKVGAAPESSAPVLLFFPPLLLLLLSSPLLSSPWRAPESSPPSSCRARACVCETVWLGLADVHHSSSQCRCVCHSLWSLDPHARTGKDSPPPFPRPRDAASLHRAGCEQVGALLASLFADEPRPLAAAFAAPSKGGGGGGGGPLRENLSGLGGPPLVSEMLIGTGTRVQPKTTTSCQRSGSKAWSCG